MRHHPRTGDLQAPLFEPAVGALTVTRELPARTAPAASASAPEVIENRRVEAAHAARSAPPVKALVGALALVVALVAVLLTRGL